MSLSKLGFRAVAPIFLLMACSSLPQAVADPTQRALTQQDFAVGRHIEISGQAPVYFFQVPDDVYRIATRNDLGDVRIFNAGDIAVPHEVSRIDPSIENSLVTAAIPFFPIEGASSERIGREGVEVSQDASGRMLKVWFSGQAPKQDDVRTSYLLDMRAFKRPLQALTIQSPDLAANKIVNVQIDGSEDLKTWRPVPSSGVLARLTYLGQNVEQNRFELPSAAMNFLRISFPDGDKVTLSGLSGEFLNTESKAAPERWISLETKANPEMPTTFLFDSAGFFPARSFRVALPQLNTFVRIRLSSRPVASAAWAPRYSGTVYRLSTKDGELDSPAQLLHAATNDRLWRLEIEGKDSQLGSGLPILQLGWLPNEIYFMAQGDPPFQLTYGSARAAKADFGLANLSAASKGEGASSELAMLGEPREIGGMASREKPVVPPEVPWKKWTLWAVLVAFLGVVALMARRLAKDLKNS